MDKEDIIRLIGTFKKFTNLWDPKNKEYHNRAKREDSWKQISIIMELPVATIKNKMKILLGSYRSEKSREKKSKMTSSSNDTIYESKWFAFEYLDFLRDKDNRNATLNTTEVTKSETESKEHILAIPLDATAASPEHTFNTPTINRKRKRAREVPNHNKIMNEALHMLHSSTAPSNDPHFTYALHVSNELKKYDARTLALVKRAIADILFQADMGTLSSDSDTMSFVMVK